MIGFIRPEEFSDKRSIGLVQDHRLGLDRLAVATDDVAEVQDPLHFWGIILHGHVGLDASRDGAADTLGAILFLEVFAFADLIDIRHNLLWGETTQARGMERTVNHLQNDLPQNRR